MNRIDALMARMTLAEKLGQLTMTASGYTVTGPVLAGNRLWIASSRGIVRSVDVLTGTPTDFAELGEAVSLAPIVATMVSITLKYRPFSTKLLMRSQL